LTTTSSTVVPSFAPCASPTRHGGPVRRLSSMRQFPAGPARPIVGPPARPIALASVFSWCVQRSRPADHLTGAPSCQHLGNLQVVPATTRLSGAAALARARWACAASRLSRELYWGYRTGVVGVGRPAIKGRSDLPYASAGPPLLTRCGHPTDEAVRSDKGQTSDGISATRK